MAGAMQPWLCALLVATAVSAALWPGISAQSESSTYGTEFYLGFMRGIGGTGLTTLRVTIGTSSDTSVTFVVESSNGVIRMGTVTSDAPVVVTIPPQMQVTGSDFANREKGIHIYATGDDPDPLYVLGENFFRFVNHGAFSVYPCLPLGDDIEQYEYRVISSDVNIGLYSEFLLVGCEDDTIVTITPTQSISIPENAQMASTALTIDPDMDHEITLGTMQTLLVLSFDDLTGTKIISNRPLTVLSGNECANVPLSKSGCEPFTVQVPPIATWGRTFLLAPFAGRNGPHHFKAVSTNDDTDFVFVCGDDSLAQPGTSVLTFSSDTFCYLESSDPVFLTEMSFGGSFESPNSQGDPSIAIVSPIDQYVSAIEFLSLRTSEFPLNYISVTVAAEHYNPARIMFDGDVLDCDWQEIADDDGTVVGYGCDHAISSSAAAPMKHTVSHLADGGLISVLVYGFNSFPAQGYAYLTGQLLAITEGDDGEGPVFEIPEFLPFLDLTNFPGVMELDNAQVDGFSDPIVIPDGLIFGDQIATLAYVNENGVISFNDPWPFSLPDRFPTDFFFTRTGLAIAVFWSDNDIRRQGAVRFSAFSSTEAVNNQEQMRWLNEVNSYIRTEEGDADFSGEWILTAVWDQVPPSPHGDDDRRGYTDEQLEKFNTYQAVIVTNVVETYAIFSYNCGGIQWSSLGVNRPAVVGFNARASPFVNNRFSGLPEIGNAVSCIFNIGKRKKRQNDPMQNGMTIDIPVDDRIAGIVRDCLTRYRSDITLLMISQQINPQGPGDPQSLANMLAPCPCSQQQASADRGRYTRFNFNCYISARPLAVELAVLGQLSLTQMCCYANGALQTSPTNGFAGTMLYYHPIIDQARYIDGDLAFRQACCSSGGFYCDKYFERRIINNCRQPQQYSPLAIGQGNGDPHYTTFDGRYYNFQSLGDYDMLIIPDVTSGDFTLQGRTKRWFGGNGAAVHYVVAFGRPGLSFQFQCPFRVFRSNPCDDITSDLPWRVDPNVELQRSGNRLTATFFEYGVVLTVDARNYGSFCWVDFRILVPRTYRSITQGFLGNLDGNRDNEFHTRQSTNPVPNVSRESEIRGHLDRHWARNRGNTCHFCSCPNRLKRQDDDEFEPVFYEDLNITDAVFDACEGNPSCIYDLIAIEDMEGAVDIARMALDHEKETNDTKDTINNFPPTIEAAAVFSVLLGEESLYPLTVEDPGDEFTLTVLGGLPAGSVLEKTQEGQFLFRWKLQAVTTQPLVFFANDSKGASSTFIPTVEVCACANEGNCTLDGLLTNNATIVLNCVCNEAFSGTFCEEDRNGCSEIQCFDGVECMDVPAPGVGAVCGACPDGYTGDAFKCYDIDECVLDETLCDQICENTAGSYVCSCMDGYQLIGENECQDINECDGVNDCQQHCNNSQGSYSCSCTEGFTLSDDDRNCTANEPCGGGCSYECAVINGAEQCYCPAGFELSIGGTQCIDRDECAISPCEQLCSNTEGSFQCGCMTGYELLGNQRNCTDIDECLQAVFNFMDLCEDPNTVCANLEGSYECRCVPGYEMVNGTCQRIDEPPPPPPPPVIPENRVEFIAPPHTTDSFTPEQQQAFREVTSEIINAFCESQICTIALERKTDTEQVRDFKVEPLNVGIALIGQNELGQLNFTFYIQRDSTDGFLLKEQLMSAIEEGKEEYIKAGFLPPIVCPPLCTHELCTATGNRRALCTMPNPVGDCSRPICRVTFCHACYYADAPRPLPGDCEKHACDVYPRLAQAGYKCHRRWSICVRRANIKSYTKARGDQERTPERFKCYEHPC